MNPTVLHAPAQGQAMPLKTEIPRFPGDFFSEGISKMNTRRILFTAAPAFAAALVAARDGEAAPDAKTVPHADFLFVQTSKRMRFDKATNMLTLDDVSSVITFFSDRPQRIAGTMRTADFVPFWSEGKNSFLSDPPNADISILEGSTLHQIIAVLHDPVLQGDSLNYTLKLLSGDVPTTGTDVSVFIDIIGMPLTPVSFAGAQRRAYRRAYMYR
jgi:hypothetical protein